MDVPRGRVPGSDCLCFDRSQLIKTRGECVLVVDHKVRWVIRWQGRVGGHFGGKRRAKREMDRRFLKVILCLSSGVMISIVISRWSEMFRMRPED